MLQTRTKLSSVELDEYDCLSLAKIIESFNAPISEDHAWALIYQCMKALDTCIRDNLIRQPQTAGSSSQLGNNENQHQQHTILSVVSPDEISIQRDGIIHHKTWCNCSNHSSNRLRTKESQTSRRTSKYYEHLFDVKIYFKHFIYEIKPSILYLCDSNFYKFSGDMRVPIVSEDKVSFANCLIS